MFKTQKEVGVCLLESPEAEDSQGTTKDGSSFNPWLEDVFTNSIGTVELCTCRKESCTLKFRLASCCFCFVFLNLKINSWGEPETR